MKLVHAKDLPWLPVSHNPEVKKKIFIPRDQIPQLMTFGMSTFEPNQEIGVHNHPTMYEVFYIQSGRASFTVSGTEMILNAGDCLTVEPGEMHSQKNPFTESVTWLYFGIATD